MSSDVIRSGLTRRGLLGLAAAAAGASVLPSLAFADPWASNETAGPGLGQGNSPNVQVRADADIYADRLSQARSGTLVRVLQEIKGWKQVYDPHADLTGFIHADLLDPADPPAKFAYLPDVPVDDELSTVTIATTDLPLYFYPTDDPRAQATMLEARRPRERSLGPSPAITTRPGSRPRTSYLATPDRPVQRRRAARLHRSLARRKPDRRGARPGLRRRRRGAGVLRHQRHQYLSHPARDVVHRASGSQRDDGQLHGRDPAQRSRRLLPQENITQYFRGTGESLHYNWWSAAWGTAGSHGCLGLSLADSRWLWDWRSLGTRAQFTPEFSQFSGIGPL